MHRIHPQPWAHPKSQRHNLHQQSTSPPPARSSRYGYRSGASQPSIASRLEAIATTSFPIFQPSSQVVQTSPESKSRAWKMWTGDIPGVPSLGFWSEQACVDCFRNSTLPTTIKRVRCLHSPCPELASTRGMTFQTVLSWLLQLSWTPSWVLLDHSGDWGRP